MTFKKDSLHVGLYFDQVCGWPTRGRHILANYDAQSIIVYQAYEFSIARFAVQHGYMGGPFRYSRMSWIKTNFLWMMYRSGWGTKKGQEVTLALRLRRSFFDSLLALAVESSFSGARYSSRAEWEKAMAFSSVRFQWDPDHDPSGAPLERRALQVGLGGASLEAFGRRELLEVIDLSQFVAKQRRNVKADRSLNLLTPIEQVYLPSDTVIQINLGLDAAT